MQGLMMDFELTITSMIQHAARFHADGEIVSRLEDGSFHRYTYGDLYLRAMQLANVLTRFEVKTGERVGTLGWNHYRHLEAYYAIPCMGAVCHTINPRLFPDQIRYIVNHAKNRILLVDPPLLSLLEDIIEEVPALKTIIVMTDSEGMPSTSLPNVYCYEDLMEKETQDFQWPALEERSASSLCYTSGTTGDPKGALYSHRSTYLQVLSICGADWFAVKNRDCILLVVPMFHINAWTLPYAATITGAKLVLPGAQLDGESIHSLIENEGVTMSGGVPTVWMGVLDYLKRANKRIDSMDRLLVAGSAPPRTLIEEYEKNYGVHVMQGWGGTECSGAATHHSFRRGQENLPETTRFDLQMKPGRPLYLVDVRIVDDEGDELPRDGNTPGTLQVKGPWIISDYYNSLNPHKKPNGWFDTGDIGTLDEHGVVTIVDRKKDLIKSGGEWISSIEIENIALGHPQVTEAAVIAIPDEKWTERPLLIVRIEPGTTVTKQSIYDHLTDRIVKWWMPDDIVFIDKMPLQATGKISKLELRKRFGDFSHAYK